ncbi:hypothetical protein WJX79_008961 [Trebouxia sp. C0005]
MAKSGQDALQQTGLLKTVLVLLDTSQQAQSSKTLSEDTAGLLSTLLLLAAKDAPPRASSLCSPSAASLLSPLLNYIASSSQPSAAAGTLGLIIHHVIWQQSLLQAAMTSLMRYSSRGPQNCLQVLRLEPCLEHVIMLQLLADELEDPVDATRSQAWQSPVASLNFAMYWVQEMCVSLASQQHPLPMSVDSLEAGLQVLRALTAQDEAEKRQDGIPKDQLITLLTLALAIQQDSGSPEQLIRLAQQFPRQSPYKGYRCDLVALLANLCFRRPAVQNKVQQLGGTELILSQCQWDDENPLVREYGLWAVRNLCEGNDAIQESISSLRAHSTVDSPDLQQIGMKIELDGKTGKPKMVAQGA